LSLEPLDEVPPAPALWPQELWPLAPWPLELAPWLDCDWPLELAPWLLLSCLALSSAAIVENETAVRPAMKR
jgi:hypothetical protein